MTATTALRDVETEETQVDEFIDLSTTSDFSFWQRQVWRFIHINPANPSEEIDWKFLLPNGDWSTDQRYILLLEGFKTLLWGLLTNDAYGKKLSVGTLPSIKVGIRELFRWFVWKKIYDFAQFSAKLQEEYLDAIPGLILDKEGVYPLFKGRLTGRRGSSRSKSQGNDDLDADEVINEFPSASFSSQTVSELEDDGITYAQVAYRVNTVYYIHSQRRLLARRNLPGLLDKPFKGLNAGQVATSIVPHVINRIPALPDSVSVPLLTEVFRWVDDLGDKISSLHQRYASTWSAKSGYLDAVFGELDAAGFGLAALAKLPWRERSDKELEGDERITSPFHRMRLSALMFRDACVLAVQYLAGLRISEVCSVEAKKKKVNGLPSCLYKRQSPDGMLDIYFLRGKITKGRSRPAKKDWPIGCVPSGSEHIPVTVRALNHLHSMVSPWFDEEGSSPLFMHFSNPVAMPTNSSNVTRATGISLMRGTRRFMRCFVDLSALPDFDEIGNDLRRYRDTKGQCIRTHQGRKTFADFCLKTRKSNISPLAFHFGHLTEAVTYKGYYEPIQRLNDELEDMAHSATVDFFVSRTEGRSVFGNMAPEIKSFLKEMGLDAIDDVRSLRAKVEDIILVNNIRIFFGGPGDCLISVAPLESRCREAAGEASFMFNRPDFIVRNVSMCAGCNCFVVRKEHLPFWIRRRDDYEKAAADPENRVAVSRYKQSVNVIKWLKKDVKPLASSKVD